MLNNVIVSQEGMMLSQKENIAVAALARIGHDTKTFIGTNGADVVVLKGDDDQTYVIQVRDHDCVVTLLG